jgi:hypothetical protein
MRTGIFITLDEADRHRLQALVADRDTPQKQVWRARIVLLSAACVGTNAVMAATGKSKTTIWRWQARFMAEGVAGLLRDKTRPPGRAPVADDKAAAIVALTLKPPPHEATHWTARAMAGAVGFAVSTVQKIWKTHGLAPHRWRAFKLSNDPAFAEKLHDIVGLYVAPPAHAVVLSVDEKSQIQALDRNRPLSTRGQAAFGVASRATGPWEQLVEVLWIVGSDAAKDVGEVCFGVDTRQFD